MNISGFFLVGIQWFAILLTAALILFGVAIRLFPHLRYKKWVHSVIECIGNTEIPEKYKTYKK